MQYWANLSEPLQCFTYSVRIGIFVLQNLEIVCVYFFHLFDLDVFRAY